MLRKIILAFIFLVCAAHDAFAIRPPLTLEKTFPNMVKVGQSRFTTLLFDVYDIALYAPKKQWQENRMAVLLIEYKLSIDGVDLAERSADEMRRQGIADKKIVSWEQQLKNIFPDVKKGTVISAFYNPQKETRFYRDNKDIGAIQDPHFGPAFFAIWLGDKTSEPNLRAELLGAP
jgi:Chalcone isomerase-like